MVETQTTLTLTASSSSISNVSNNQIREQRSISPGSTEQTLSLPWNDTPIDQQQESSDLNIQINGDSLRLDQLGPMVINANGTISRISNWTQMSDVERAATIRIITKRNRERRHALMEAESRRVNSEHPPDR